jgi:hypothetical protein
MNYFRRVALIHGRKMEALRRYKALMDGELYQAAVANLSVRSAGALLDDASAWCGHPMHKVSHRRWGSAARAFLDPFVMAWLERECSDHAFHEERFDHELFCRATAHQSQKRNYRLIRDAWALSGSPFQRLSRTNWSADCLAFLQKFTGEQSVALGDRVEEE